MVLPGSDHREVSYHAEAFAQTYRFITGRDPATSAITPESRVVLDGLVTGHRPWRADQPAAGRRHGRGVCHRRRHRRAPRCGHCCKTTVGADGRWGPLRADSKTPLEFVVTASGYAITHIYRSPFPRSSNVVHLRAERLTPPTATRCCGGDLTRPRGYFGLPRDLIKFDNHNPVPGVSPGVAGVASSRLVLSDAASRPVVGDYRSGAIAERVVGRIWPAADNHLVTLELHY